jgi:hypothetical protein
MEEDGPMYPYYAIEELAEQRREDMLRAARAARLAREAASNRAGRRGRRLHVITFALRRRPRSAT